MQTARRTHGFTESVIRVSSFHADRDPARREIRFAFCKTEDVLAEAGRRLEAIRR